MKCPLYDKIRRNVFVILRTYGKKDLNVTLYGNTELSVDQNKDFMFGMVQPLRK
jgi:hypothetical protein